MIRYLLHATLAGLGLWFAGLWRRNWASSEGGTESTSPSPVEVAIGFVTNFFDTLGIGSFAPTTSAFKLLGVVADRLIPGTLLVGHTFPTLAQAFIYITIIEVDMRTLTSLIAAAVLGSWLGAGVVAPWPKRRIQVAMGIALLVAAGIFIATGLGYLPAGGDAVGLGGVRMAIALAGNFVFGALMTIGIGAYAPSLVLFGLLGLNLKSIFPVMMGSCAFLMPVGGARFVKLRSYAPRAAFGLALGGVPGVLLAAFLVGEMPLAALRWLVVVVVTYTAITMLRSAMETSA